ncbi:uncharacterized protein AKAW2_30036S [Aspergillus luchuensis]|uniref:C2H2-type domain-containing protein n=1 Tax=Aspergillus kawachii TaxID=1069201 RepID=A0A7R7W5G0_ASPKA|nr:uncharacterized protein AKAW2_30036S [Aspergillus luchuensis]BCR96717.1 hypothetical protein AKAW2_30036S [Aspergillus luchuensis]
MASLQRQLNTLKKVLEKTSINVICPLCLRGFSRADVLYAHFRQEGGEDTMHAGLAMKQADFGTFISCYERAMGASIPSSMLRDGHECFKTWFIVENYRRDAENGAVHPDASLGELFNFDALDDCESTCV